MTPRDGELPEGIVVPVGLRDCRDEPITHERVYDAARMLAYSRVYRPDQALTDENVPWQRVMLAAPELVEEAIRVKAVDTNHTSQPELEVAPEPDPEPAADALPESSPPSGTRTDTPARTNGDAQPILSDEHRSHLRTSGLSDATIALAGLYTERDPRALAKILERPYKPCWGSAIVFPLIAPGSTEPRAHRIRPDNPRTEKRDNGRERPVKYDQARPAGQLVYFPPRARSNGWYADASRVLYIVEGEKKGLALDQLGYACLALTGCWNYLDPARDKSGSDRFDPQITEHIVLAGRDVVVVLDQDYKTNPMVELAARRLADLLYAHGARNVWKVVSDVPGAKAVDDHLALCGEPATRAMLARTKLMRRTHGSTVLASAAQAPVTTPAPPPPRPTSDPGAAHDSEWKHKLTSDKRGIKGSIRNIALILEHRAEWTGKLSCDMRAGEIEVAPNSPISTDSTAVRYYADRDDATFAIWLEEQYRIDIAPTSPKLRGAVINAARKREHDPVGDYLDGLTWDSRPRLDRLLIDYAGAPDEAITRKLGAMWMISAVARTYKPGCKVDHMLILEGEQGSAKSTFCATLAGDDYFGDELPDLRSKDSSDYLRGLWIVEIAELDRMHHSAVNTFKAFVSRATDRYRPAYASRTGNFPRRCVFIGTTNSAVYLADPTGGRRFWPVRTKTVDLDALRRDRDQLWAEARERFRANEPWHLAAKTDINAAKELQERRRVEHPWESPIREHLEDKLVQADGTTMNVILSRILKIDLARQDRAASTKVGQVLARFGWVVSERATDNDGSRPRRYRPKGKETDPHQDGRS